MSDKAVPLGELVLLNPETLPDTTPAEFQFRYVDLSSISEGVVAYDSLAVLTFSSAPSRARRVLRNEDVLFGTVRPERRLHALIDRCNDIPLIASTGFCVVRARPDLSNPAFLFHSIRSDRRSPSSPAGSRIWLSGTHRKRCRQSRTAKFAAV
jgi:type I restriction enzyme S subunit